jgi:glycosyltransferase involved in cell wall biosynthesis
MRIAHIANTLPPYWSGTGVVVLNLAQALARRGHDVHVFTPVTKSNRHQAYDLVTVHKQSTFFRIGQAPLTPGILLARGFDLYHLHFPYYFGAELACVNSTLRGIPLIITYHNDVVKPGLPGKLVSLHSRYLAPLILQKASYICVMSDQFRKTSPLLRAFASSEKLMIIPQGVDVQQFTPDGTRESTRELAGRSRYILFVRSLDQAHYHSGLSYLLSAMVKVEPDYNLVVVGDGSLRKDYERESAHLGISDRVRFLGSVPNRELPSIYASASAFVLPSEETENASVVLMEAMACGIPVIATDVGGTRDIVRSNLDGLLVPPRDADVLASAINLILASPDLADRMGSAARERVVKESSWDSVAAKYDTLYEKVICESA